MNRLHALLLRTGTVGGFLLAAAFLPSCTSEEQVLFPPMDSRGGATSQGGGGSGSEGLDGGAGGAPSTEPFRGERVAVSAGDAHSCATVDGQLYCWGSNASGELGLDDFDARNRPALVDGRNTWSQPGTGSFLSCALRDQRAYCWGRGASGQIGSGSFSSVAQPTEVEGPSFIRLAVGHEHVCGITDSNELHCWGHNTEGQLGLGDPFPSPGVSRATPQRVGTESDWIAISAGQGHSCGIQSPGELYCWGRNSRGELGLGPDASGQIRLPQRVGSDADWEQVDAGQNHTCGVRAGALYCWGSSNFGQLGLDGTDPVVRPEAVDLNAPVLSASVDTFHSCARLIDGEVQCFGRNLEGQLGREGTQERWGPTPLLPGPWEAVAVGRFHTCAVAAGNVFCTGQNLEGRLGVGDQSQRREMTRLRSVF